MDKNLKDINAQFKEKWESQDVQNIMYKVTNCYGKNVHEDEIESTKMVTLWKCLLKYDESKGSKFTSYLYQQLNYAMKNLWKLESKHRVGEASLDTKPNSQNSDLANTKRTLRDCGESSILEEQKDFDMENHMKCLDILTGLKSEHALILKQRFYRNMTMKEIGRENGYSRETARRKLQRAIDCCKKSSL